MKKLILTMTDRRKALVGGVGVLASGVGVLTSAFFPRHAAAETTANPLSENAMSPAPEYAIFTELSPASKPIAAGWNTRVFTDVDVQKGNKIQCDLTTGVLTLASGAYHLTGMSMVAYNSGGEPAEMATIRAPASAGYCRLRRLDPNATVDTGSRRIENNDPSVICIGSPSTANLTPSLFEAYYETDKTAHILLEHQSGDHPAQIYLRVFVENSKWHAMARISIRLI